MFKWMSYGALVATAFVVALFSHNTRDHSLRGMFTLDIPTAHADAPIPPAPPVGGTAGIGVSDGCTDSDCSSDGSDCGGAGG